MKKKFTQIHILYLNMKHTKDHSLLAEPFLYDCSSNLHIILYIYGRITKIQIDGNQFSFVDICSRQCKLIIGIYLIQDDIIMPLNSKKYSQ